MAAPAPRFSAEPGWVGVFTRAEAEGAYRNGSRVWKVMCEKGDLHPLGSLATVLGSLAAPGVGTGYFVEWDARPRHAVFVSARKVALA